MNHAPKICSLCLGLWLSGPLALGASPVVDQFSCSIEITSGEDAPFRADLHLASVRKETEPPGSNMIYLEPGRDLEAIVTTPSGYVIDFLPLFTFKRPTASASWGLHTCLSGYSQNPGEYPDGWACPEMYFSVGEENGVPLFDSDFGKTFGQQLDRDGRHLVLSCSHIATLY